MKILLIEDNEGDIALFKEALLINKIEAKLNIVKDGEKAINYLKSLNPTNLSNGVDLIIIDINLPKVSGKEILKYIGSRSDLNQVPRIFLSTSNLGIDIDYCYKNKGDCFLTKPNDVFEFFNLIAKITQFWSLEKKNKSVEKKTSEKVLEGVNELF